MSGRVGNIVLSGPTEVLYQQSESIFGAYARKLVSLGWSVFPQEVEGRRPGRVFGETIKWQEAHNLTERLPTAEALDLWCNHCGTLNVAAVFGPASGNTFAVDIDVMDPVMSDAIVAIAEEILGPTPFMREGRAPKIALIYRHGPEESERIPNISRKFAQVTTSGDAERSEDGLELLGARKLITFFGRHHKTGTYFRWLKDNPLLSGPQAAPLVTVDQVKTFMEAVDAQFRFHRGNSLASDAEIARIEDVCGFRIPKLYLAGGGLPWTFDDDDKIIDGREAYLTSLVWRIISENAIRLELAQQNGSAELRKFKSEITAIIVDQFERTAALTGRWRKSYVIAQAKEKVSRVIENHVSGRNKIQKPRNRIKAEERELTIPAPAERPQPDGELSFLRANRPSTLGMTNGRGKLKGYVEPPPEGEKSLALPKDRKAIAKMVQDGLEHAFKDFLSDIYGAPDGYGDQRRTRVHVLKAPTGAGKTSRWIRTVATDPRTFEDYDWIDPDNGKVERIRAPYVMLLPTYQNIDELRTRAKVLNLDGELSDEQLRKQAAEEGLIQEDEMEGKLAELRRDAMNCGLISMTYSGKLKAGCQMSDKVELAMNAGMGTSALCETVVRDKETKETEVERCEFYAGCPVIAQRQEINNCHIVFMPHSFLALTIPDELKKVRAVVADERIHHLFLHSQTFSAMTLNIGRQPPRLTKRERELGLEPDELMMDREAAARVALAALRAGECPAEALIDFSTPGRTGANLEPDGPRLVQSALRVCGSAIQRDARLKPSMPVEDIRSLCSRPTGREIREEWQFWKIIEERIALLRHDRLRNQAIRSLERDLLDKEDPEELNKINERLARMRALPDRACGDRDYRIQMLTDPSSNGGTAEIIRISWRTRPNWQGTPMMLLDASAAPPIIAKIWEMPEEDIAVHDIVEDTGLSLNTMIVGVVNQTFSNSSLIAAPEALNTVKANAARNLAKVRAAISSVAALHGDGRVVCGTSIVLRELINKNWTCPENVDWCHFGAMRGLDGFKFHGAALSIGRMEVPIRSIDALVAALTYDDVEPELPMDKLGTGTDPNDPTSPLRIEMGEQRIRLRSGYRAVLPVPTVKGKWGRLIQKQYREEELLQFVGRLRPVYREGRAPVWYALSSIIPDELIVDDLIHIDDLLHDKWWMLWEGARRTGGVIQPELIAAACPEIFTSGFEAVQDIMYRAGFRALGEQSKGRMVRGFATMAWTDEAGDRRVAFVQRSVVDRAERLREAMKNFLNVDVKDIEEIKHADKRHKMLTLARPRLPDKVEDSIGKKEERKTREINQHKAASSYALTFGPLHTEFPIRQYKDVGTDMPAMTLNEIESYVSIEEHWKSKDARSDSSKAPIVTEDGKADPDRVNYEHMGATARDNDEVENAAA